MEEPKSENINLDEYTDDQLKTMVHENNPQVRIIREFLKQALSGITNEAQRLEAELSDFTQRNAAILMVATLFAFFPISTPVFAEHMAKWVYPFLLLGIFAFIFSTRKPTIHKQTFGIPLEGSDTEIVLLRRELNALMQILDILSGESRNSRFFSRITVTTTLVYFLAFTMQYYYYLLLGFPGTWVSIYITLASVDMGIFFLLSRVKRGRRISPHVH